MALNAVWGVLVLSKAFTPGPVAVHATGYYDNNASGALTFNLLSLAAYDFTNFNSPQFCFQNSIGKSGVITIQAPSSTLIVLKEAVGSHRGNLTSGGALGDPV